ncbi:hypothetical protein SPSYN_01138 [Sporotomaculum syntrophicum]|uniref:Uncharacterized protein n=1 Tax=Sporotomaculum syntrophicum TaxID=182264 RepID=A0A9D3AXF7_9FIRM|nr:hypothetical protein [Sporotomaculum syntrophicum]KAF1085002.1 hypothetical protein SPSYN_01138 [Sporotomaculum syntrophicum]
MKKLFDETYEHSRTVWYISDEADDVIEAIFGAPSEYGGRMIMPTDYNAMISRLKELIRSDLANAPEPKPTATQWVFYSNLVSDDAIGDKVRFSIYIRLKEGKYECNINITDFLLATSFDEVIKIRNLIEQCLNIDNR